MTLSFFAAVLSSTPRTSCGLRSAAGFRRASSAAMSVSVVPALTLVSEFWFLVSDSCFSVFFLFLLPLRKGLFCVHAYLPVRAVGILKALMKPCYHLYGKIADLDRLYLDINPMPGQSAASAI